MATPSVELNETSKVSLYGTGFAPKQEVLFVFKDTGGVQTVISTDALSPAPVPNEAGAWVSVWDAGQYISLLKGDATIVIDVTDSNYKTITPLRFTLLRRRRRRKSPRNNSSPGKSTETRSGSGWCRCLTVFPSISSSRVSR